MHAHQDHARQRADAHYARRTPEFGVSVGPVAVDLPKVVARKNEIVLSWREGHERQAAKRPTITLYRGSAQFTGPHTVAVNGEALTGEHIFINTGTSPRVPPIEGLRGVPYLTNKTILDLTEIPKHLIVLGGSYVGLEFGQMFRRFGSQVTVIEYGDQIVPREDEDVARVLREALETEGIAFLTGTEAQTVGSQGGTLRVTVRDRRTGAPQTFEGSHILVAVGREPNTEDLGLEAAGVKAQRGWVTVNEYLETNVPGVYALGDVNGGPAFTHISYNDFQIAFHNLFNQPRLSTTGRLIPYALFTDPELGRVGMTEKEARASGRRVQVGSIPMSRVARAIERNETQGLMKVVVDADTQRILGAAMLGTGGGELVQTLMALMMADVSWKLFYQAVYIHPTMTEGFFALMDSVK